MRLAVALAALALPATLAAQYQQGAPLRADQRLAHDIYKEMVEINTADSVGSTTVAANAMAKRLRDAGFAESDIFLGGPRADKGNIVVRYHGNGSSGRKPLLLLAHLDVVEALKKDWSPDIDPFVFTERDGYYYGRGSGDDKAMASIFVANAHSVQAGALRPRPRHHSRADGRRRGRAGERRALAHRQPPRADRRGVRAQRGRRRVAARRQAVHQLGRRGGEDVGELHRVDGEPRRTFVGAARRQRHL